MNAAIRFRLFSLVTIWILLVSLMIPLAVLAEGELPPAEEAAATESSGEAPPAEESTTVGTSETATNAVSEDCVPTAEQDCEEEVTATEVLEAAPEGTELVVLDENGEALPLASEEAAQIVSTGDPMWCQEGSLPGGPGCTSAFTYFGDAGVAGGLLYELANGAYSGNGTIYVADDYDSSLESGSIFIDYADFELSDLTIQGGWDFTTNTVVGASQFNVSLTIANWDDNLTLSDLIFYETGGVGLYVDEAGGNVSLNNVESSHNDAGAYIESLGDGKTVSVNNSRFRDNGYTGLDVFADGDISLNDVYADYNQGYGAYLSTLNNVSITGGTFNGNYYDGVHADVEGNIVVTNADAQWNGYDGGNGGTYNGMYLYSDEGTVSVTGGGFNENGDNGLYVSADGGITLTNLISADNGLDGAYLYTSDGAVDVSNSQFVDNYQDGYGLYIGWAETGVTLTNVLAAWNDYAGFYTYNNGGLTINDSVFNNNEDGGLYLEYVDGEVELNNVEASNNDNEGFYGEVKGNFTVNGGVFNNNNGEGLRLNYVYGNITLDDVQANGNIFTGASMHNGVAADVTITDSEFNYNSEYGLYVDSDGNVSLENVSASGNDGSNGAYLDNTDGTGAVSVTDSVFNTNHSDTGLRILSKGMVTLVGVVASFNAWHGASIDNCAYEPVNCTSSAPVSISDSTFNANDQVGLYVSTGGNLSLDNVTGGGNGDFGAVLGANGDITDSGTNSFNNNGNTTGSHCGGEVDASGGSVTLDDCVGVDTNVWFTTGGGAVTHSYTTINAAITDINTNAYVLDDGILYIDSALTPYVEDAYLDGGDAELSAITQIMGGGSGSTLVVGNLFFGDYTNGFSVSGLSFSEFVEGASNEGEVSLADIYVAGLETSMYVCDQGYGIDICSNDGPITLNGVTANGIYNGSGIALENSESSSLQPVTLTDTHFDGNEFIGLYVNAFGEVTLSNVTGSFNRYNYGAAIHANNGDASIAQDVTVEDSEFSYNGPWYGGYGLYVESYGDITLSDVSSNGNNGNNAYLYLGGETGDISVSDGSFSYSMIDSDGYGIYAENDAEGSIFISGVHADSNYYGGAYLYNAYGNEGSGSISVLNSTFNYSYDDHGLTAYNSNNGDILLDGVTGNGGYYNGAYLQNYGNTGNINVLNSTFNYSQSAGGGLEAYNFTDGTINLSNVVTLGNFYGGAYLENTEGNTGDVNVTNSTFNNSVYRGEGWANGLEITTGNTGDVTVTDVTANGNAGAGLFITHYGTGNVFVDPSTFNINSIGVDIWVGNSNIQLDQVTSKFNEDRGAYLGVNEGGDAIVNCSTFKNHAGLGIFNDVSGTLYLNGVTFGGNNGEDVEYSGSAVENTADCNPVPPDGGGGGGGSTIILPVTGGVGFPIDCANPEVFTALMEDEDEVLFSLLCGLNGVLVEDEPDGVPGELPEGSELLKAHTVAVVDEGGQPVDPLPDGASITLKFLVEDEEAEYAILYWNGSEWQEVEGELVEEDGTFYFQTEVEFTGTFVIVTK